MSLADLLCRMCGRRALEAERERVRLIIGRVMEENEQPEVILALGRVLELVEEQTDDSSSNGREA